MQELTVYDRPLKILHGFEKDREGITRRLQSLASLGFGGVVTNVSFENYMEDPAAWDLLRHTAAECERLGLRFWLYDEKGYPSGGCGGKTLRDHPDYECRAVVMIAEPLAPGGRVTVALPRGHERFLCAAVYRTAGEEIADFTPVCAPPCRGETGAVTLENPTGGPALACAFAEKRLYEGTHAEHNVCECRRYIDVTYPPAVRAFLDNTYERYARELPGRMNAAELGGARPPAGAVEAVFTDEPSLMGCYINRKIYPPTTLDAYDDTLPMYPLVNWGHDFENAFTALCGYSPLPGLIYAFAGRTEEAKRYRLDYHRTLSRLFEQAFFAQISNWCAEHRLNFSGHVLLEDKIRHHVLFEGNYFSLLRHMHYPGIDMLHSTPEYIYDDHYFAPKLVASVAAAYGRRHVMSEVSAHAEGGKVSIPQQYASLCLQFAFGVDIFTYYYGEDFMPPETYAKYNAAHARIDRRMAGETVADVLLYYPIETFQMHHLGSDRQYGAYVPEEEACEASLCGLALGMIRRQIDYHFADFEYLARCRVENGRLVTPAGRVYRALLLPAMEQTEEMRALFSRLAAAGLPVYALADPLFAAPAAGAVFDSPDALLDGVDRSAFASADAACTGRVAALCRDGAEGRRFLFVNGGAEDARVALTLHGTADPVLYDPLEDRVLPMRAAPAASGVRVEFALPGFGALIVGPDEKG